jgi:putative membrane protein
MTDSSEGREVPLPATNLREATVLFVKGVMMGTADIIPGVSGGTVALIVGVYRRLIESIKAWTPAAVIALLKTLPGFTKDPGPTYTELRRLHVDFLVPLGLGIVSAVLIAARIIPQLLKDHPEHMNGLFFGLIVISVYVPLSHIRERTPLVPVVAIGAAVGAYVLVGLPLMEGKASLLFLFFCGAIAICAMVLPGVSGSYLLKALGQYEHVLTAVHERDVVTVGVFMLGIIVGITSFVRLLSFLLRRYEAVTLAALSGLMVGSLRSVWPFQNVVDGRRNMTMPDGFGSFELGVFGMVVLGVVLVVALLVADRKFGTTRGA